jgi:hypothetical protein
MRALHRIIVGLTLSVPSVVYAQAPPPAKVTDVYHVHFAKAVPGQAAALAADLKKQDPKAPQQGHTLLLRHQEGDDWDYCLIEHMGTSASVTVGTPPAPNAPPLSAWHTDTFVAGPSWAEFSKAMALAGGQTANSVYVVSVHRAVPGHRDQLATVLNQPNPASKIPVSHVTLAHLEGGPWQFLSLDRYNSWQDFGASEAASAQSTGSGKDGWSEVRQHSAYHTDTLADRIAPK